jgi:hypothetical protein
MGLEPVSGGKPEVRVRLEFLGKLLKPRVILLFFTDQEFTLVVQSSLLNAILEPLVD